MEWTDIFASVFEELVQRVLWIPIHFNEIPFRPNLNSNQNDVDSQRTVNLKQKDIRQDKIL